MAHPSPSPSVSSRRRRLSEVLREQQEPFSLDLYLLESGCSPAFLKATSCGGGACSTCWPNTRSTGRALRRPARNTGSHRIGVLKMLLSKILSGAMAPAATNNRQQRAAIEWRGVAEKQRTPDGFELSHGPASPGAMEDDGVHEDDEESSKKQLSPVSVLEQSLFEHSSSPPPPHSPKTLAMFGELLEAAYTPNSLLDDDFLAIAKDGCRRSSTDSSTPTTTPWTRGRRKKKHERRRKDDMAVWLSSVVASEMAGAASVRAAELRPSVEDVGALIAAAVLEALTEETAAELMGMDHGTVVRTMVTSVVGFSGG